MHAANFRSCKDVCTYAINCPYFPQVDPSKLFEVYGQMTYDAVNQRIRTLDFVDFEEQRDIFNVILLYQQVKQTATCAWCISMMTDFELHFPSYYSKLATG